MLSTLGEVLRAMEVIHRLEILEIADILKRARRDSDRRRGGGKSGGGSEEEGELGVRFLLIWVPR